MYSEEKKAINKEKVLMLILIAAIIIVIVILLLPSNGKQNVTVVKGDNVTIKLHGDNPYYLLKGKQYEEPGYEAYEKNGTQVSYKIRKSGSVNPDVPGRYEIVYEAEGTVARRTVIVPDLDVVMIADSEDYTNEEYNIMLSIKGADYDKTVLPNGETTIDRAIEYEISDNGTYAFILYDRYKNQIKVEKTVNNFDKEAPIGNCTNKLDLGKTYVEVEATDKLSGIASYVYQNGVEDIPSTSSKHEYSELYKDVNVVLIDKLGNKATIKCTSSGEGAMAQIQPPSGANIIRKSESNTLKVSVEKKSNYYVTRIWVLDPYNQIRKGTSNWGSNAITPAKIIENDVNSHNFQDKIIVAINGSGFYNGSAWTPSCSSSCQNDYKYTTEGGLAITDGRVVRSWYQDSYVDRARNDAVYAISKDGYLEVYPNTNSYSESERKNLFDSIISKGYKNTWMFRPVIMTDGRISESSVLGTFLSSPNKRSIVCQINRNNYVMLTALSHGVSELKPILTGLGCKTAINFDGGGSVALLYKSKGGNVETLYGGGRSIVDVFYFVEK